MARNFVYVGSWLDDAKENGGIHLYEQEEDTGRLRHVEDYASEMSVGFFCISPDKKYLYAVDEIKRKPDKILCGGSVHAFSIDQGSGRLTHINSVPTAGIFPCYITIDSQGRYLFVANYGSEDVTINSEVDENGRYFLRHKFDEASVAVIKICGGGKLDGVIDLVTLNGVPSKAYEYFQSSPHPHSISISPSDEMVLVTDRGCDELLMYGFDSCSGKLKLLEVLKTRIGTGPRNAVFHPDIPCFYVASELMPYVTAYTYDSQTGKICELGCIATVPENKIPENFDNFFEDAHPADICMHPDSRHLYVSNRGTDTIAVFKVSETDGSLVPDGCTASGGAWPWTLRWSESGSFFYTGNKKTNNIVLFYLDSNTGGLKETGLSIGVERPVCIRTLMLL
ncbi:6-phosphogluconolactonase [Ruminiclostridium sufflavum DSM 19573]|uniref:6-phosphogluconolactonase n=1 Tax=Ruminiclostridium sufflavum DSM 19573 TaxID=1121337 RepID=A0A318XPL8_9FIRM|nr:lactonase family protein [Ruminiclostridium sufflavum]PYG90261.1 6-phosphogluconolactonase [Ruminiclostridium sufflavum DSM 19573]